MAQNNSSKGAALPSPRMVRTTHNEDGVSIFADDSHITPFHPFGPQSGGFTTFDSRAAVPIVNTDTIPEFHAAIPRAPSHGAVFAVTDIPPGGVAPMHRTLSLDYAAVMHGEIVLRLDGGEEKPVKAGEFIVQQGVNHQWLNLGDEVCRMAFVMLGAEKVVVKGETLEETVMPKPA